jgi:hypothetical protein
MRGRVTRPEAARLADPQTRVARLGRSAGPGARIGDRRRLIGIGTSGGPWACDRRRLRPDPRPRLSHLGGPSVNGYVPGRGHQRARVAPAGSRPCSAPGGSLRMFPNGNEPDHPRGRSRQVAEVMKRRPQRPWRGRGARSDLPPRLNQHVLPVSAAAEVGRPGSGGDGVQPPRPANRSRRAMSRSSARSEGSPLMSRT